MQAIHHQGQENLRLRQDLLYAVQANQLGAPQQGAPVQVPQQPPQQQPQPQAPSRGQRHTSRAGISRTIDQQSDDSESDEDPRSRELTDKNSRAIRKKVGLDRWRQQDEYNRESAVHHRKEWTDKGMWVYPVEETKGLM
ncbi:hypothetical protein WMY93_034336 [Mugilogobius chulae]|uniref:Uncharacterized protein n=1 Tax=Mugilogobius chulae TaxID=88201 RepID=A0AAW0MJT2_9GOBI